MNRSHHKDIDHHHHHHHRPQQNGTESRPYHYHPYNRYNKLNGLSSEFELSTDTDDDSLVGEADSSNHLSPLDIASEALKDADQKDREKVLNIIKMLLHENLQISLKNANLLRELQRKDDEIADLVQASRRAHTTTTSNTFLTSSRSDTSSNSNDGSSKYPSESEDQKTDDPFRKDDRSDEEKDIEKAKSSLTKCNDSVTIHVLDSTKAKAEEPSLEYNKHAKSESAATITVTKTVIEVGKPPKASDAAEMKPTTNGTNANANANITSTKFVSKNGTEVIRMPLKKSVRRTPTETAATVVVMQPHKLREEARDKSCDKLDKISRNFDKNLRSLSPPPPTPSANLVTAKATE